MSGERRKDWYYWRRGRRNYRRRFYPYELNEEYPIYYEEDRRHGWNSPWRHGWREEYIEEYPWYRRDGMIEGTDIRYHREHNSSSLVRQEQNRQIQQRIAEETREETSSRTEKKDNKETQGGSRVNIEEMDDFVSMEEIRDLSISSVNTSIIEESPEAAEAARIKGEIEEPEPIEEAEEDRNSSNKEEKSEEYQHRTEESNETIISDVGVDEDIMESDKSAAASEDASDQTKNTIVEDESQEDRQDEKQDESQEDRHYISVIESSESAETSEYIPNEKKTPSIYTYLIAKYKVEEEEKGKIDIKNKAEKKEIKEEAIETEVEKWARNKSLKLMGMDKDIIEESIKIADERSRINEALIPEREPAKLMSYLYNDNIRNIKARHKTNSMVYMYRGDEAILRKAFAEIGKDFRRIRKSYLPWYTHKEIVKIYYKMKYKLRLKNWNGVLKDIRKIQDKELNEIVERDWSTDQREVFGNLYSELGKKWKEYMRYIQNKTENDLKIFYKYFKKNILKKKEEKTKKREEKKEGNSDRWKIHERQTFALLFPHIGKNWGVLANYIVTRTASEIRSYHRLYYKNLREGERVLEIYLKDIGEKKIRTDPLPLEERAGHKQHHSKYAGVLFSCK